MTPRNKGSRQSRTPGTPGSSTKQAARTATVRRRLPDDAVCVLCGETNAHTLMIAPHHLLEGHHVVGQHHDGEFIVVLCRNCHTKCSIAQLDDAVPLRACATFPERLVAILVAFASFLRQCADACAQWARQLHAFIQHLDTHDATWRDQSWAQ